MGRLVSAAASGRQKKTEAASKTSFIFVSMFAPQIIPSRERARCSSRRENLVERAGKPLPIAHLAARDQRQQVVSAAAARAKRRWPFAQVRARRWSQFLSSPARMGASQTTATFPAQLSLPPPLPSGTAIPAAFSFAKGTHVVSAAEIREGSLRIARPAKSSSLLSLFRRASIALAISPKRTDSVKRLCSARLPLRSRSPQASCHSKFASPPLHAAPRATR